MIKYVNAAWILFVFARVMPAHFDFIPIIAIQAIRSANTDKSIDILITTMCLAMRKSLFDRKMLKLYCVVLGESTLCSYDNTH